MLLNQQTWRVDFGSACDALPVLRVSAYLPQGDVAGCTEQGGRPLQLGGLPSTLCFYRCSRGVQKDGGLANNLDGNMSPSLRAVVRSRVGNGSLIF